MLSVYMGGKVQYCTQSAWLLICLVETTKISNAVYEHLPNQCKNKIEASFFSKSARRETTGSQIPQITNALLDELKLSLEVTFPLKSIAAEKTQALLVPNDARLRAPKKGTILRTELNCAQSCTPGSRICTVTVQIHCSP